jgi:hypothetical protein
MGQAIGGSLPLAVGIALSPIPIIAVVLMLTSRRAKETARPSSWAGLAGLGVVGAIAAALSGVNPRTCCWPWPALPPSQRGHHDRAVSDHLGQGHRRRHQRAHRLRPHVNREPPDPSSLCDWQIKCVGIKLLGQYPKSAYGVQCHAHHEAGDYHEDNPY